MFLRDSNDSPHLIHIWTAAAELLLSKSFIQASAHAAIVLRGRRNVFSATVRLPREPRNIAALTMASVPDQRILRSSEPVATRSFVGPIGFVAGSRTFVPAPWAKAPTWPILVGCDDSPSNADGE